ncbi:MAG: hypothetical protein CL916_03345 [Deltaproteobacteria bacterium]|nr:hypothetical protein [Deltaproteobacteria bacterium]
MSVSSFYPLFRKTKLGLGVSHPDIFMTWVGGIDFSYRLSRKKKSITLSLATYLPIFQHLSSILSHQHIDVYSVEDLPSSTKLALSSGGTVFCKTIRKDGSEIFHVNDVHKDAIILNGRTHTIQELMCSWDLFQLHVLENPHEYTCKEITRRALIQFVHSFSSALHNLDRWSLLLRRASMRNSWKDLLNTKKGYFILAIQTYQQCSLSARVHREQFVSSLSHSALWLSIPELAQAARFFQKSSQQWQRIGEVLISLEDPALQEAMLKIRLQTWNHTDEQRLCDQFEQSRISIDLPFRLEVLQATLTRIIDLEAKGVEAIVKGTGLYEEPLQSHYA